MGPARACLAHDLVPVRSPWAHRSDLRTSSAPTWGEVLQGEAPRARETREMGLPTTPRESELAEISLPPSPLPPISAMGDGHSLKSYWFIGPLSEKPNIHTVKKEHNSTRRPPSGQLQYPAQVRRREERLVGRVVDCAPLLGALARSLVPCWLREQPPWVNRADSALRALMAQRRFPSLGVGLGFLALCFWMQEGAE